MATAAFDFALTDYQPSLQLEAIDIATQKWTSAFNLSYHSELTKLTGYVYHNLSFDSLCYANAVHIFLWIFDDYVDNKERETQPKLQLIQQCLSVCQKHLYNLKKIKTTEPIARLLVDLLNRPIASLLQVYICEQLLDYFMGVIEHIGIGQLDLNVKLYNRIRLADGACEVVWPLCLLDQSGSTLETSIKYLRSKDGRRARRWATKNVSYVNDILSVAKDKRSNEFHFNIVNCWMQEYKMTEAEAIAALTTRCNKYYIKLKDHGDEYLARWCAGSLQWHLNALRYR